MRIDILTLFPGVFGEVFDTSIFQRAVENGLISVAIHNIRDYTHDKHRTADDYPYGGGAGMVLKPEPIFETVAAVKKGITAVGELQVILLSPRGRLFSQAVAAELSGYDNLVLICGRYEGVDERVSVHMVTDEISIGDYVLSGGELAAMVVVDAVVRLLPGVLGSSESPQDDSYVTGLLEYPHYTRPAEYRGWSVPKVLLSGNHAEIARWRREQAIIRTLARRPELLDGLELDEWERQVVDAWKEGRHGKEDGDA